MPPLDSVLVDHNLPLCAGVFVFDGASVLLAVSTDERWVRRGRETHIPVNGIGGGQEPGETMVACALREAREEVGCDVRVLHSAVTYAEVEGEALSVEVCRSRPAPLLYQVQRRASPEPYAPGLPSGARLHVGIFRAVPCAEPFPHDVPALLWVPLGSLARLASGLNVTDLGQAGIRPVHSSRLPKAAVLFIPRPSTEDMLRRVVTRFGVKVVSEVARGGADVTA